MAAGASAPAKRGQGPARGRPPYQQSTGVEDAHAMIELTKLSDAELSDRLQTALGRLGVQINAGELVDLKALPNGGNGSEK